MQPVPPSSLHPLLSFFGMSPRNQVRSNPTTPDQTDLVNAIRMKSVKPFFPLSADRDALIFKRWRTIGPRRAASPRRGGAGPAAKAPPRRTRRYGPTLRHLRTA